MSQTVKSIRPFVGAQDFEVSRCFYRDLGFDEVVLSAGFSYFKMGDFGFYLQDAYVKDWIDNTMVFVEVADVDAFWNQLQTRNLTQYPTVRLLPIHHYDWGKECFVHDPSGVLWHFGEFHG